MTPVLRPEQKDFVDGIHKGWGEHRSILGVYPTGGGKTFCFSHIVSTHNGSALITAHRKKIIIQISKSLALFGVKHRIIAPAHVAREARRQHLRVFGKSCIDQSAIVGVASVQTLTSKSSAASIALKRWVANVSLGVFDEGHHYVSSGQWANAVQFLPDSCKLLFVTATPERCDGKGLGVMADGFIDAMVVGPPVKWQIENKRLSNYRYLCPPTDFKVDDIPITSGGDFNSKAFRAKVVDSELVGDVVAHYETHVNRKKTIIFATDVETAIEMESAFKNAGHNAKQLNCKTPIHEADRALENYEIGRLRILINVDLFDEGFDVPDTEAVIMGRPTMSLGKFLQQIGRALRVAENKTSATIIDCVRNWERHGLPDWPRVWTLNARERRVKKKNDEIKLKVCVKCTRPYESFKKICPHCGHADKPIARRKPEQVGGDLFELDIDALNKIFDAVRKADMPAAEYQKDLECRGCPAIGIPRNVRAHMAAKRRRQVLRRLVDWWAGAVKARGISDSEIHTRFYARFGVDIGTAFTLNEKGTNALIDRIAEKYAEDVCIK